MSQPQQAAPKKRDPPPALFLHPSPAASHVSLPSTNTVATPPAQPHPALQHSHSPDPLAAAMSSLAANPTPAPAPRRTGAGSALNLPPLQTSYARRESTRATDRTDALWAEMQATLEEVELSASGGTRVFGPEHDRKLAELRAAQIALAQAWARSEADEAIETTAATKTSAAGAAAEELQHKLPMDDGTESDIAFARKRREANDRYFSRVNQGVLDVVAKLEHVATAMRAVEQESKDVWGDESSLPSSARP